MRRLAVLAGMGLYVVLCVTSLAQKSPVFDEAAHLPAGYTYWKLGDHRLNPEHPPLVKLLAAAPLLAMDVKLKTSGEAWALRRQWEFGRRFLYRWNDANRLLFWGRMPVVILGALLCLAVCFRARALFGPPAAALALLLCVLSPDVLAHGQIVTTDVGIALFVFLSVIAFDLLTQRATWCRLLAVGLAVGAAFATKFSAPVLVPILTALGATAVFSREPMLADFGRSAPRPLITRWERLGHIALWLLAVGLVALVVLWASYGFEPRLSADPSVEGAFEWSRVHPQRRLVAAATGFARGRRLLPEAYLFGLLRVFKHSETRPAFLMGRMSEEGWWYYFPVTFALKTPIPLMALLVIGVAVRRSRVLSRRGELFLWLPIVIYLLATLTRNINIGHRHLLPIYPFLFVSAGRAAAWAAAKGPRSAATLLVVVLASWYAIGTLRLHPHYLAYFNELAGGPANGYRYLVDSNLDWGQDLPGLKAYMERNGLRRIKLSYFGTGDPAYYGIDCDLLPGYPPPRRVVREVSPGEIVAVSATNLQGVYLEPEVRPLMERLRAMKPIASIGWSIVVYRADFAWALPGGP